MFVITRATTKALPSLPQKIGTIEASGEAANLVFDDVTNTIIGLNETYKYKSTSQ
jgi:hypothetical protein